MIENQILLEKIGQTKTQKVIDDCYKIYKEKLDKKYPEYFSKNSSKMCSLVTTTEKNEIKAIGMSKLNDLLTDNWGLILGGILDGASRNNITLKDETGIGTFQFRVWGTQTQVMFITNSGSVGSQIKVGTGTTAPTRQDFRMETLVQTLVSGNGGWNSGLGKVDIPATGTAGSGFSISETGLFGRWVAWAFLVVKTIMIAHDAISPVVPVINGQSINVDYELLLS